jgi:long-chain fatty acid transport protein
MLKTVLRIALMASVGVVAIGSAAHAGGFANRQQSATGQGFSFAGAGTSAFGLSSMFWNPANITNFEGRNSDWNLSIIAPNSQLTTERYTFAPTGTPGFNPLIGISPLGSGNLNQTTVAPATYNALQLTDRIWIGLQNGAPFGNITKADPGFAGAVYGTSTKVRVQALTPTVGYKVNDWISIGFGLTLQQMTVDLKSGEPRWGGLAVALPGLPSLARPNLSLSSATTRIKGDGYGIGWTAGITLKPWAGGEISLGYRSHVKHELRGEFDQFVTTAVPPVLPFGPRSTLIKTNVNLPEIVTLGLKQDINPQWTVTGTVQWTNWSRVNTAPLVNRTTGAPITGLGFRYRDEWFFSAGVQYNWNQNLSLRAGIAYELAPITNETRGVRVLDSNRLWLSAGVGYQLTNKLKIDVGYSFLALESGRVDIVGVGNPANPAGNPSFTAYNYQGTTKAHSHIVAFGIKYRWDDPAPAAAVSKKF